MFPTIVSFGKDFILSTYGTAIAIGFMLGIFLIMREAKRVGLPPQIILNMTFWMLIFGLVGARILFILVNLKIYYNACYFPHLVKELKSVEPHCYEIIKFWKGGLVFYGGFIGGFLAGYLYMRRYRLNFFEVADICSPALMIGLFVGRFGCLSAGCCFGKITDSAVGIIFPAYSQASQMQVEMGLLASKRLPSLAIHPTQLYEALACLLIFFILIFLRHRKRFHGQVFLALLILYPLLRSLIEIFRGDSERGYLFRVVVPSVNRFLHFEATDPILFSTAQFISTLIILSAIGLWAYLKKRQKSLES